MAPNSSLPELWAFRGLWDRFAPPNSDGAFWRSYIKGMPSVVSMRDISTNFTPLMEMLSDPAVNRKRSPSLFLYPEQYEVHQLAAYAQRLDIFIALADMNRPFLRVEKLGMDGTLSSVGTYVPSDIPLAELSIQSSQPISLMFCEALNCRTTYKDTFPTEDTERLKILQSIYGSSSQYIRVSDLAEMDLLVAQEQGD